MAQVQTKADEACALHDKKAVLTTDAAGLCVKYDRGSRVFRRGPLAFCDEYQFVFACVEAED